MSQENVELVQRLYEAGLFDQDPAEWLPELATPDIEYVNPPDAVEPGVRRGPETWWQRCKVSPKSGGTRGTSCTSCSTSETLWSPPSAGTRSAGEARRSSSKRRRTPGPSGRGHRTVRVGAELEQRASGRRSGSLARLRPSRGQHKISTASRPGSKTKTRLVAAYARLLLRREMDPRAASRAPRPIRSAQKVEVNARDASTSATARSTMEADDDSSTVPSRRRHAPLQGCWRSTGADGEARWRAPVAGIRRSLARRW